MCPHRKYCIQQQHPLPCPGLQTAIVRHAAAQIRFQLLKNILQGWWRWHIWQHRKAQTMGLPRLMIWVLPKDNHLGIRQAGIVQGIEYRIHIRKDLPGTVLIYKKLTKLFIIWLLHFRKQILLPIICKNSHSYHLTRSIPQQMKTEKGTTKSSPHFLDFTVKIFSDFCTGFHGHNLFKMCLGLIHGYRTNLFLYLWNGRSTHT